MGREFILDFISKTDFEEHVLQTLNEYQEVLKSIDLKKFNSNIIKLQNVISLLTKQVNVLDIQVESSPIEEVIAKMYEEMHIS